MNGVRALFGVQKFNEGTDTALEAEVLRDFFRRSFIADSDRNARVEEGLLAKPCFNRFIIEFDGFKNSFVGPEANVKTVKIRRARFAEFFNNVTAFKRDVISYENKIFLLESFILGITYANNVEAAILEHIVWIYKNKDYSARLNKEEITCTLCLVTDKKQLIRIPKVPEDVCDLVIQKVQKLYPHIMAEEE